MAQKFYHYICEDGTEIGIVAESGIMNTIYNNVVKKAAQANGAAVPADDPVAYDSLALLQVDFPTAIAKPNSLSVRGLNLTIAAFGTVFMPILKNTYFVTDATGLGWGDYRLTIAAYILMNAETPFPADVVTLGDLELTLTGARGETRLSN